jgi:hypothetical protein
MVSWAASPAGRPSAAARSTAVRPLVKAPSPAGVERRQGAVPARGRVAVPGAACCDGVFGGGAVAEAEGAGDDRRSTRQFRLSSARRRKNARTDEKPGEVKQQVRRHGRGMPQVGIEGMTEPGLQAGSPPSHRSDLRRSVGQCTFGAHARLCEYPVEGMRAAARVTPVCAMIFTVIARRTYQTLLARMPPGQGRDSSWRSSI